MANEPIVFSNNYKEKLTNLNKQRRALTKENINDIPQIYSISDNSIDKYENSDNVRIKQSAEELFRLHDLSLRNINIEDLKLLIDSDDIQANKLNIKYESVKSDFIEKVKEFITYYNKVIDTYIKRLKKTNKLKNDIIARRSNRDLDAEIATLVTSPLTLDSYTTLNAMDEFINTLATRLSKNNGKDENYPVLSLEKEISNSLDVRNGTITKLELKITKPYADTETIIQYGSVPFGTGSEFDSVSSYVTLRDLVNQNTSPIETFVEKFNNYYRYDIINKYNDLKVAENTEKAANEEYGKFKALLEKELRTLKEAFNGWVEGLPKLPNIKNYINGIEDISSIDGYDTNLMDYDTLNQQGGLINYLLVEKPDFKNAVANFDAFIKKQDKYYDYATQWYKYSEMQSILNEIKSIEAKYKKATTFVAYCKKATEDQRNWDKSFIEQLKNSIGIYTNLLTKVLESITPGEIPGEIDALTAKLEVLSKGKVELIKALMDDPKSNVITKFTKDNIRFTAENQSPTEGPFDSKYINHKLFDEVTTFIDDKKKAINERIGKLKEAYSKGIKESNENKLVGASTVLDSTVDVDTMITSLLPKIKAVESITVVEKYLDNPAYVEELKQAKEAKIKELKSAFVGYLEAHYNEDNLDELKAFYNENKPTDEETKEGNEKELLDEVNKRITALNKAVNTKIYESWKEDETKPKKLTEAINEVIQPDGILDTVYNAVGGDQ